MHAASYGSAPLYALVYTRDIYLYGPPFLSLHPNHVVLLSRNALSTFVALLILKTGALRVSVSEALKPNIWPACLPP